MAPKRAYRGDPSKSTALGATPAGGAQPPAKKKRRGPKAFIDLPRGNLADGGSRPRPSGADEETEEDEDEEIRNALEAEGMVHGFYEDSDDEEEVVREKAKGKKAAPDASFLLKLDDKAISR